MSMWERIKAGLGLSSEYDEYEDDDEEGGSSYDETESRERLYRTPYAESMSVRRLSREPDLDRARDAVPRGIPSVDEPAGASRQVNMHIAKPKAYGEAQTVGDRFKAGTPVIMDLTMTDPDLSKRLIDFASGLTYGLNGGLQKVSDKVFLLTPPNVSVSAEDRRRLQDTGLFKFDG